MSYKEKLIQWNSTEKYRSELRFIEKLLEIDYENDSNDYILDYGCGIGTLMDDFICDGFDVTDYYLGKDRRRYHLFTLPNKFYQNIVFNHVLAHIPNPIDVLKELKQRYNEAKITVITPNAYWLMLQKNPNYKPDPTVVKHYTQTQLKELFEQAGYEIGLIGQFGDETNGVNERIFLQTK